MPGVTPLLVRHDSRELTRHKLRESGRAQRDDAPAFRQSAPRRLLVHGENDQFDGGRQIQIAGLRFMSPSAARGCGTSGGIRIEAHPLTVGGQIARQLGVRGKRYFGRCDDVFGAILPPASRGQAATLVAVIVEADHRYRLADHKSIGRQGERVFESLVKRPELLLLAVGVNDDFRDQRVQFHQIHGMTSPVLGNNCDLSQVSQNGISQSSCADKSVASQSSETKASASSSESAWAKTSLGSQSQVWAKTKPVSSNLRSSSGCFRARNLSLLVL